MKLTIDRKKWLRGEGSATSLLLRRGDGKMCCLGFYGLACGLKETDILGISNPNYLIAGFASVESHNRWVKAKKGGAWLFDQTNPSLWSNDCKMLMTINDALPRCLSQKEREQKIKNIFAKHNVQVKFIY
jgi:hypothetical protein